MTKLLGLILVVFAAKNTFLFCQKRFAAGLSLAFERDLKINILDSFFKSDWKFYLTEKSGTMMNAVNSQARQASEAFKIFSILSLEALNVLIYCALGVLISPPAFLVSLGAGAISFLILRGIIGRSRLIGRQGLLIRNDSSGRLMEDIQGIKFIKGNRFEEHRKKDVFGLFEKVMRVELRGETYAATMETFPDFIMAAVVCVIVWFSHDRLHVPGESLLVLIMVLYRMNRRLMSVQSLRQRLVLYLPAFELCRDLVRRADERREPTGSRRFEGLRQGVRFEDAGFAYVEGRPVLRSVTLGIAKNRLTAIVGRSGSGKTTLVDTVLGLLRPDSGKILIDGTDLGEYDLYSWRDRISYVPQDVMLLNGTIADNIRMGNPAVSDADVESAAKLAFAHDFIRAWPEGYATLVGDRGIKLSGGQRQRVALARSLAKKPDLLILDEATSALDNESERMVQSAIEALKGKFTILVVAHRLSTIERADVIYVLDQGGVKQSGTFNELKAVEGLFGELYGLR